MMDTNTCKWSCHPLGSEELLAVMFDSVTPRTAARKGLLSRGCPRILGVGCMPDPWGGSHPGDLAHAGTELGSPALRASRKPFEGLAFTPVAGEGSEGGHAGLRADWGKGAATPFFICSKMSKKDFSARALGDHCEKSHTI